MLQALSPVPLLAVALIEQFGWQGALRAIGVLIIVIASPLAFFVEDDPGPSNCRSSTTSPANSALRTTPHRSSTSIRTRNESPRELSNRSCPASLSTWEKSGLIAKSAVRLEVIPYFTFTPASYVDPYLDYIRVSLDNALWLGRHWLPRRQETEIRRERSLLYVASTRARDDRIDRRG